MHSSKLLFLSYSIGALAAPSRLSYSIKERNNIPESWARVGDAPADHILNLRIGLKQSNEDGLENHLFEISDPTHHRYKQYLGLDEIVGLTQPSKETQESVEAWLQDHDIQDHTWNEPHRDWITVSVPIEKAEQLLQTKYSTYFHEESSDVVHRTHEWSLPKHLHEHIDVIQPTTSFFRASTKAPRGNTANLKRSFDLFDARKDKNVPKECKPASKAGHPDCIRALYGTIDYVPQVPGKNKIAITNYVNQSSHRKDIAKYLRLYRPEAESAAQEFQIKIIADAENFQGRYNKSGDYYDINIEGDLDAETVLGIAWPTPLTAYNTGGLAADGESEPFLVWQNYMRGQKDIPQVISNSYGDDETLLPEAYARRVCRGFAELGARGVSVLFSAGDKGVAGRNGSCFPDREFVPHFPASCPWVTAVGGTRDLGPETALDYGGGGFSSYFKRPEYQKKKNGAVDSYVKSLGDKYEGRYNADGRGYPDVAAQGDGLAAVQAGEDIGLSGTSASTPIFAAVISLVNDALIAKGEPPLGFLNPWIYSGGYKALTNINDKTTYGGCGTKGFPVVDGWDAVTGFGTPNFKKLLKAAFAK